jgi:hypothetical protein
MSDIRIAYCTVCKREHGFGYDGIGCPVNLPQCEERRSESVTERTSPQSNTGRTRPADWDRLLDEMQARLRPLLCRFANDARERFPLASHHFPASQSEPTSVAAGKRAVQGEQDAIGKDLPDGDDFWIRRDGDWRIVTGELSHGNREVYFGWKGMETASGLLNQLPRGGWIKAQTPLAAGERAELGRLLSNARRDRDIGMKWMRCAERIGIAAGYEHAEQEASPDFFADKVCELVERLKGELNKHQHADMARILANDVEPDEVTDLRQQLIAAEHRLAEAWQLAEKWKDNDNPYYAESYVARATELEAALKADTLTPADKAEDTYKQAFSDLRDTLDRLGAQAEALLDPDYRWSPGEALAELVQAAPKWKAERDRLKAAMEAILSLNTPVHSSKAPNIFKCMDIARSALAGAKPQ